MKKFISLIILLLVLLLPLAEAVKSVEINWSCFVVNYTHWTQVWQYGSNLGGPSPDPDYLQDGVAPQAKVGGNFPESKRAYIPDDSPKGFISSHSISNYGWIFNLPKTIPNTNGYVTPR